MTSVSVSELKANLSRYLREVKRGGEVQVTDRGVPVARLSGIPAGEESDDELRQRLAKAGILRLGNGDTSVLLDSEPVRVGTSVLDALLEERVEGR